MAVGKSDMIYWPSKLIITLDGQKVHAQLIQFEGYITFYPVCKEMGGGGGREGGGDALAQPKC